MGGIGGFFTRRGDRINAAHAPGWELVAGEMRLP
jgi:hypothetical protein